VKPKTLRGLTRELRYLNEVFDGPATVCLALADGHVYILDPQLASLGLCGAELIPGDAQPFDAVAAARRLLAAHRDELEVWARKRDAARLRNLS
jgi:hypothetical protein